MESPQRPMPDEPRDQAADTAAFRAFVDRQPPSSAGSGRGFRTLALIGGIIVVVVVIVALVV